MASNLILQLGFYVIVLLALAKPLGAYMARVYTGRGCGLDRALGWLERLIYRLAGVRADEEMTWKTYALTMLLFNLSGLLAVYALQRLQGVLPLNPEGLAAVSPDSSFNTAVSFATNTNWQGYGGESTMSYLTQMLALTVQNFVSAAAGMAVLAAMIRGFARRSAQTIGNFWVDMTRTTLYILLPLSFFVEVLSILGISGALCSTFGVMVGDTRQGWAVLAAMTVIFIGLLLVCVVAEQNGAVFVKQGVDHTATALQSGGNMEGKEVRFGIANSALWATATTGASNGSVNSMHDSFTQIGRAHV